MSAFSSAQSTKLAFISNLEGQSKPMKRRSKICFSSKEYAEKLEKALPFALLFLVRLWWQTVILLIFGCFIGFAGKHDTDKSSSTQKVTIFLFYEFDERGFWW